MTHRERFKRALSHRESDHVPFDIGGSVITGIASIACEKLIARLGLPSRPIHIRNIMSQTAEIDEDILEYFGVDTRPTDLHEPTGWRLEIFEQDGYECFIDEWKITYARPLASRLSYDIVGHPLSNVQTIEEIERFPWPNGADPARFTGLAEQAKYLSETRQVGVILETNIGGIYEWPAWLRGVENFLTDLADNPMMAQALMEKITEFKIAFWETALTKAGKWIDLVRESDDLAGQNGLFFSKDTYHKFMKPLHKRIFETIRKHTDAAICLHSCGSVWDLIPDLIETGINVLNPVQVGAANMDTKALKREFGHDLVFWGGACDSQKVLPYATPAEVKEEARRIIGDLAPGGGYIFAPINMIQSDVPPHNIIALWEAIRDYGNY